MAFEVEFEDPDLERLEMDPSFTAGWAREIVRSYRKKINHIRSAVDERDFYKLKSLHFERLKPPRDHQHSMRLNIQWRLIVELKGTPGNKKISIIGIEDYH